jgi:hypothetical protein
LNVEVVFNLDVLCCHTLLLSEFGISKAVPHKDS